MQEANSASGLQTSIWDVAILGESVDARGHAARSFLSNLGTRLVEVRYDEEEFSLYIDGQKINAEDLGTKFVEFQGKSLVCEASSLGFVEIFLACRTLKDLNFRRVDLIYVEPGQYSNPRRTHILSKRDFELSDQVPGYRAIPGATMMLSDKTARKGVFFLGYEARRLDRALQDYQMIRPSNCCVVFGVPAFKPGWEMDAFANNIRVIKDNNLSGGVHFCGAENPLAAFDVLELIYTELQSKERMFVAPIGTKPNGIGVALFVAAHPEVGILYDHPKRKAGRSSSVARWHLYEVEL